MFIWHLSVRERMCDTLVERLACSGCSTLTFFVSEWDRPPFIPRHFVKSTSSLPSDQSVIVKCHLVLSETEEIVLLLHVCVCACLLCVCVCVRVSHILAIYLSNCFIKSCVWRCVWVCVAAEEACLNVCCDVTLPLSGLMPECNRNRWKKWDSILRNSI